MGADNVLVTGAATAHKDRQSGADVYGGLDKITNTLVAQGQERKAEKKKEALELANKQEQMGAKFQQAAVDMAPHMKTLGADAWAATKTEVGGLREQMNDAIANDDKDAQVELMAKLNEIKSRAVKDKDGYESLIDAHKEGLYDSKSMTPEGMDAHDNFLNNPSKRFVPSKDGKGGGYEWDVLDENGERIQAVSPAGDPMFDMVNGEKKPIYETKSYTIEEINNFGVMPDTENGTKVMDFVQAQKELFSKGTQPDVANIKSEIAKMIPTDANKLRSWAFGNPTENTDLDIYGYLMDHPLLNEGQYKDLGVEDTNGDGFINSKDVVSAKDRESLINSIMNVDNPKITHEILTDIYSTVSFNSIRGVDNKNYNESSQQLMQEDDGITASTEISSKHQNALNGIKTFKDKPYTTTALQLAKDLNVGVNDKIMDPETGETITVQSLFDKGKFDANSYKTK